MKKIISVLAMALLVIGAVQAQEQVRKMVVQLKTGQVVGYNTENVEAVTFKTVAIPTTIEEAKAMLVGCWNMNMTLNDDYPEDFEGLYFVITEDLDVLLCYKIKDSVTDDFFVPYAGKYLVGDNYGEVIFPSEDPTTFYLGVEHWFIGTNLQSDSFNYTVDDGYYPYTYPAVRVEPFDYIFPEDDYLFKGKRGLR